MSSWRSKGQLNNRSCAPSLVEEFLYLLLGMSSLIFLNNSSLALNFFWSFGVVLMEELRQCWFIEKTCGSHYQFFRVVLYKPVILLFWGQAASIAKILLIFWSVAVGGLVAGVPPNQFGFCDFWKIQPRDDGSICCYKYDSIYGVHNSIRFV